MLPIPGLSSLATKALVVVGVALAAFIYGQHVNNNAWKAKMLAEEQQAQAQYAAAVQKATAAENALDAARQQAAQQSQAMQKRLAELEKRPQYQNACLDQDGINAANDALGNHAGSGSVQ